MSSFLFATLPAVGHTAPALPIARTLVERGHTVRWYAGAAFAEPIRDVGATYCAMSDDDYSAVGLDEYFPERRDVRGVRKLQFDMVHAFAGPVTTQVRDLQALLREAPADVIVTDSGVVGAGPLSELTGLPWAVVGISVVGYPSRDVAPFGTGLGPVTGRLGRLRNRVLDQLARRVIFRPMTRAVNEQRATLGLPPTDQIVFEYPLAADLALQLSSAGFEYPRSDLPAQVRYVGPPRPAAGDVVLPSWWPQLDGSRPVVLVTQGTVATDAAELLRPTLEALADEDVLVIGTTGGPDPAQLGPLPTNARVERRLPFDALLPHVDAFVTNGGFGGVQLALAHGVPIVAAGKTEDKAEVAGRVAYSGVGLDLRTQTPTPGAVRRAVVEVLTEPSFTAAAQRIAAEIAQAGREERAADLLEQLASGVGSGARMSDRRPTVEA